MGYPNLKKTDTKINGLVNPNPACAQLAIGKDQIHEKGFSTIEKWRNYKYNHTMIQDSLISSAECY